MEKSLGPHHEEDEYPARVVPVEDATGRLDDLAIAPPAQLRWFRAAVWMLGELLDMTEDALNERGSSNWVVQRDVVCDRVQITEGGLSPDYFSHRAMRCLACA